MGTDSLTTEQDRPWFSIQGDKPDNCRDLSAEVSGRFTTSAWYP